MKIAIDFDDTIVKTSDKVKEYLNKYNIKELNNLAEKYEFYKKHIDDITKNLDFFDDVVDVLKKLSINNELYLITARSNYYSKNLKDLTIKFIKDNKLPFKEIYFECFEIGKAIKCEELNIDLFIDDYYANCLEVSKKGIDTLLFKNECDNLKTVNSWQDILKYVEG